MLGDGSGGGGAERRGMEFRELRRGGVSFEIIFL
jgi:hypothetical protein